jgi:gas vesicle protein
MIGVLIAGVFTIIGGVIGFIVQLLLRKEKFKEIIYKEKLAASIELSKRLWHFKTTALEVIVSKVEMEKLEEEAPDIREFIWGKGFLISESVSEKADKFVVDTVFSVSCLKAEVELAATSREVFSLVQDKYRKVSNALRQDLHADLISEDIYKTLKFGDKIMGGNNKGTAYPDQESQKC